MEKTSTDKLIPYYVWFIYGFSTISIFMGIINFGMVMITTITVKGIFVPIWMVPVIGCLLGIICISVGHYFEKYSISNRISSHQNQNMNPEIKQLSDDVKEIKKMLEDKK
jgi:hypothetical protein